MPKFKPEEQYFGERERVLGREQEFLRGLEPERAAARERFGRLTPEVTGAYRGFAQTGGISPETAGRARTFFTGMQQTGGFTPEEISGYRARAAAAVPAVFGRAREQVRLAARGRGYATPATEAAYSRLTRQAAQETAEQTREAELGLAEAVRAGRERGVAGEIGLEETLRAGKETGIGGLENMAKLALDEQGNIDVNRLRAYGMTDDQIRSFYGVMTQFKTSQPGLFTRIMKGIGAGVGAATGLAGLGGMFGGGGGAPTPGIGGGQSLSM